MTTANPERVSVQPEWATMLPLQQQSVMLLAARGPDGVGKFHPCKPVQRAYRGTVLCAAARRRPLEWGERGDTFMTLHEIAEPAAWHGAVEAFFATWDELPHHFILHLLHGAQIIGYKHPDPRLRTAWGYFYSTGTYEMHLTPECEAEMDDRLNDFDGEWEREAVKA